MSHVSVRCPSASCRTLFEVSPERLGRSLRCPSCGGRMTARPLSVESQLRRQEQLLSGEEAAVPVDRLELAVLVDNVRSLWNVGSIFRTADACGFERVVLAGITGCPPRAEISKTALGAECAVSWRYRADPLEALVELERAGYSAVALENSSRAVELDLLDWPTRACLIIGNEVSGVSPELLEHCQDHAAIPMRGVKSSLNVAVAFGIAAHRAAVVSSANARVQPGAGIGVER